MPRIRITDAAMVAIRSQAEFEFCQTGEQQPDGTWIIPLDEETVERIQGNMLPGEEFSDCIVRVVATVSHGAN